MHFNGRMEHFLIVAGVGTNGFKIIIRPYSSAISFARNDTTFSYTVVRTYRTAMLELRCSTCH